MPCSIHINDKLFYCCGTNYSAMQLAIIRCDPFQNPSWQLRGEQRFYPEFPFPKNKTKAIFK